MISFLAGCYRGMDLGGALTIDVNGVGYSVLVSDRDRREINVNGTHYSLELYARTTADENTVTIYGFLDENDRSLFDRLVKVKGVGPGMALKLLSVMDAEAFSAVVKAKDVAALTKVPGVGKTTAEKLIAGVKLPPVLVSS